MNDTNDRFHRRLGGEDAVIRCLVDVFYDRMDREPAFAPLRALHPPTLTGSATSCSGFSVAGLAAKGTT
jgi:truncated hemoglobin YjbI